MVAVRQEAQIVAVLIHDREPLDPPVERSGLGDVDDAGVEIAGLAGQPFVDRVGHLVGDAPPRFRGGTQFESQHILLGEHIPQAELDGEPFGLSVIDPADHERLRVDDPPIRKSRPLHRIVFLPEEGGRVERAEEAGALEVARDHLRDPAARLRVGKTGDRDGQGLHAAARDVDRQIGAGIGGEPGEEQRQGKGGRAGERPARLRQWFHCRTIVPASGRTGAAPVIPAARTSS